MNIRLYYIIYFIFVLALVIIGLGILFFDTRIHAEQSETAIPVVLAYNEAQTSRSSAVHIGNGYYLTSTHILRKDQQELVVKTSLGQTLVLDLIWSSKAYDISLLYAPDNQLVSIQHYELNCEPLNIGDDLVLSETPFI
jgi:hypothetical protein